MHISSKEMFYVINVSVRYTDKEFYLAFTLIFILTSWLKSMKKQTNEGRYFEVLGKLLKC